MNWDDLRFFAVLAREKTLAAASRRLGVDQTTVARRLRALEEALGAALFERSGGQWRLTGLGLRTLDRAEQIEDGVAGIVRSAEVESQTVSGGVRITSVAVLSGSYLIRHLAELYARHPELVIDLVDSDANLNISRHEADIAIRASRPESGDFIIRKLAVMGFAVYESARERSPAPDDWVAYNEDLAHVPEMRWLETRIGAGRIRLRDSDTRTLRGAIATGIGRGILPCFLGDGDPDLRRSAPGEVLLRRDVWMLIHREARASARVAVVAEWLVDRFVADADIFRGESAVPRRAAESAPADIGVRRRARGETRNGRRARGTR